MMRGTMGTSGFWGYQLIALMMITTATLSFGSRDHITPQNHQYNLNTLGNLSSSRNRPRPRSPPPPPSPPFDYYLLALQGPKSFCHVKSSLCDKNYNTTLLRKFTVHGLWPENNSGNDPPLNNVPFDSAKIQNSNDLAKNWMDAKFKYNDKLKSPIEKQARDANILFWSEQWKKHGDRNKLSQTDYFKQAMKAYNTFDVTTTVTSFVKERFGQPLDSTKLITEL